MTKILLVKIGCSLIFLGVLGLLSLTQSPTEPLFIQPPVVRATEPVPLSEREQIIAYIRERFGVRADDALKMILTCENKRLDPRVIHRNKNGSVDVGIFQVNTRDTREMERLKDWKYNVDRAVEKYRKKGNTFYFWTCGKVVGDWTYVDQLKRGK